MQNKVGYLITAYKDFDAVYGLASLLSEKDEVFIHVDKKSKEIGRAELDKLNALPRCHAVSVYTIAWGGYTHVQALLVLMGMAAAREDVSYLHFLTGEDFPVLAPDRLHERFVGDGHIYLSYIEEKDFNPAVQKRCYYYNLFQNKNVKNPFLWQLQDLTVKVQKLLGIRRKALGEFEEIYKGLVYISMPIAAARDILEYVRNHPEYEKALYCCQIPEEFFFHTLLLNEKFCDGRWKSCIVDRELRYMNWTGGDGGSPAYLDEEDYGEIAAGDYCFARKFHSRGDQGLKEKIMGNLW